MKSVGKGIKDDGQVAVRITGVLVFCLFLSTFLVFKTGFPEEKYQSGMLIENPAVTGNKPPAVPVRAGKEERAGFQPGTRKSEELSVSLKEIPPETHEVLKENRFLEEELKLARTPQYYFVLNLRDGMLELKARGMVLRVWKAKKIRYTGKPVPLQVTSLKNKTALNPPERKVVKPGAGQPQETEKKTGAPTSENKNKKKEEKRESQETARTATDSFEVEALEITDMPSSFELNFDNDLRIYVRSPADSREKWRRIKENFLWYAWNPVKYLINRKSELQPQLILYFDTHRQSQGIYWAFVDGIKGIIWYP
ncbi:MAG: hypothetical protein QME28_05890 [Candidatus Saccharicenans sp.]|nr:hypothetical protein [Candidatus Saccharicenans sp.]